MPVRFYKERDTIILHALTLTSASAMTMSISATPIHHVTHIPCNSSWFSAEAECSNTRVKSRGATQYPTAHDVAPTRVDMQVSAVLLCELRQDEGTPQDGTQCKVKATGGCQCAKVFGHLSKCTQSSVNKKIVRFIIVWRSVSATGSFNCSSRRWMIDVGR